MAIATIGALSGLRRRIKADSQYRGTSVNVLQRRRRPLIIWTDSGCEERRLSKATWPGLRMHELIAAVGYVPRQNVLRNQRACADVGACSDVDAAYNQSAPADERAGFDHWRRFIGDRVVPGDRRIKLPVDEISRDAATRPYAAVITNMASDNRIVINGDTDAYPRAACHHDPRSDYTSGLDFDEILELRIGTNPHPLPDDGELANPHSGFYDGPWLSSHLSAILQRTEAAANYGGGSYQRGRGDHDRIRADHRVTHRSRAGGRGGTSLHVRPQVSPVAAWLLCRRSAGIFVPARPANIFALLRSRPLPGL